MFESLIEEIFLDNCGQMEKVNRSKKLVRLQAKSCEQYDRLFAVLDAVMHHRGALLKDSR